MPDGDVVYHGVGRGYVQAYKELCEGHFDDKHIAASIAKALKRGLRRYGNKPIILISRTYSGASSAIENGYAPDFREESREIDEIARELMGHRRGIPIAADACKEYILAAAGATQNIEVNEVIKIYITRVLKADFLEHLPLVNHHNEADPVVVEERLKRLQPHLEIEIEFLARQIAKTGKIDRLTKPRRSKSAPPDFENMDVTFSND